MADNDKPAPLELMQQLHQPVPSNCSAELLDFDKLGMKGYSGDFAIMIHNMLSPAECEALLKAAEATFDGKWEQAMVNVGNGKQRLITDQRNCGRILWDSPEIVDALGNRIKRFLPEDVMTLTNRIRITGNGPVKRKETWKMTRLNERLRFLKYSKGMYFREHCDGSYVTPDGSEITFLTVHVYLNTQSTEPVDYKDVRPDYEKPLIGGATRFSTFGSDNVYDVNPTTGSCLVFQHRNLMHSGEEVDQGTKYTVRTDILFNKVE